MNRRKFRIDFERLRIQGNGLSKLAAAGVNCGKIGKSLGGGREAFEVSAEELLRPREVALLQGQPALREEIRQNEEKRDEH